MSKSKKPKWQRDADHRRELEKIAYGGKPQRWPSPDQWIRQEFGRAEEAAVLGLVRRFPHLTRAQLEAVLELAGRKGFTAKHLVDGILDKLDGPLGKALLPTTPAKPAAKSKPKAAKKPAKKTGKKTAKSKAPKASLSSTKPASAPKSKRKPVTDRILEVLEAKRPAAVAKPILRKELGNVSGAGLDKAIGKLLEQEKIVGSDPYSLAGVVDESTGPLFGEQDAAQ